MPRVQRISGHSFIEDRLRPEATVLDLGISEADFSRAMIERYGCRVVGVEPVPRLYEAARAIGGLEARHAAIGDGGEVELHLSDRMDAATTTASMREEGAEVVRVPSVTLDALLSVAPERLARVDQLAVEFHDVADAAQARRVAEVKRRLRGLGFRVLQFSRDNTDVLFVNAARLPVGPARHAWIAGRYKYPRGLGRVARRLTGAT